MQLEPSPPDRPYLHQWDASRYKRAYLFGDVPEAKVQDDIRRALGYFRVEAAVIDAGFSAIRGKVYSALKRLRVADSVIQAVMAALKDIAAAPVGWSDLNGCLAPSGRAFYIECKSPARLDPQRGTIITPAGRPSADQLNFLDRMHARGALVGVAWSVDDALQILAPALADHKLSFR
jgi:hypothetical protein